eukprot:g530.t1
MSFVRVTKFKGNESSNLNTVVRSAPIVAGVVGSFLVLHAMSAADKDKNNVGLRWMLTESGECNEESVSKCMDFIDTNHDGHISEKEFMDGILRYIMENRHLIEVPAVLYDPAEPGAKERARMETESMNARILEEVVRESKKAFEFLNLDGDDVITREELKDGMVQYNAKIQSDIRAAEKYGVAGVVLLAGTGCFYAFKLYTFLGEL